MTQAEETDRSAPDDSPRDRGVTFVEVLVTVVLLGTVVLGILTAARTSVIASRTARAAAEVETALLTAAERVERADRADYECDFSLPVYAAVQLRFGVTAAEAPSYASLSYEHLDEDDNSWQSGACPTTGYQTGLVQRITITMVNPDTGLSRTLQVVKSDV